MKNIKLNKEEKKILKDFEEGKLGSVKDIKKVKDSYRQYVKQTLDKPRIINIRLSERDLQKLKALAAKKGLSYQTLISSVLY
jgi:predicted DNA binding CopG/RHH family protein